MLKRTVLLVGMVLVLIVTLVFAARAFAQEDQTVEYSNDCPALVFVTATVSEFFAAPSIEGDYLRSWYDAYAPEGPIVYAMGLVPAGTHTLRVSASGSATFDVNVTMYQLCLP